MDPPWAIRPSLSPGDDAYWRTEPGRGWLLHIFLPFYDSLGAPEQLAYQARWNVPTAWLTQFLHPDLDRAFAEADTQDFGTAESALDYRQLIRDIED